MTGFLERAKEDWQELNIWLRIALLPLILVGLLLILGGGLFFLSFLTGFFYGFFSEWYDLILAEPKVFIGLLFVLVFGVSGGLLIKAVETP